MTTTITPSGYITAFMKCIYESSSLVCLYVIGVVYTFSFYFLDDNEDLYRCQTCTKTFTGFDELFLHQRELGEFLLAALMIQFEVCTLTVTQELEDSQ